MDAITLVLTPFQAGEVEYGLDIDAADHAGEPLWGEVNMTGKRRSKGGVDQRRGRLVIRGTQLARDRALYRITSTRDIWLDNAGDSFGDRSENLAAAARGRSMDGLARKLVDAAGGPDGFSPDVRRWIRY